MKIDKTSREILTEEYNQKVTIWNHYIKMEETGHTATKYMDSVDLYAGISTSAAAWWTLRFSIPACRDAEPDQDIRM